MSAHDLASDPIPSAPAETGLKELPFPPVTRKHILNCSYHSWHPKLVIPSLYGVNEPNTLKDIEPLHLKHASFLCPPPF